MIAIVYGVNVFLFLSPAEVGDYNPNEHEDGRYISQFRFVPNQQNSMETKIQEYHKNHM